MSNAAPYVVEPDAHWRPALPFPLVLLVCFLVGDGLERTGELVYRLVMDAQPLAPQPHPYRIPMVVTPFWIAVDGLLVALILLRSSAGRLCTQGIFVIHLFYLFHVLVVNEPLLWLYLGEVGRARVVLTAAVDVIAVGYLFTPRALRALDE